MNCKFIRFFLLNLYLLSLCSAYGQDFESYDVVVIPEQAEMMSTDIYCMLQDKDGYIWFGTRAGLSRFDGHSFTHQYYEDQTTLVMMKDIVQDSSGIIWAGGAYGLFYVLDDQVAHVPGIGHHITTLHIDNNDNLLIGGLQFAPLQITSEQRQAVVEHNRTEIEWLVDSSHWRREAITRRVWDLKTDDEGGIWVGMDFQLMRLTNGQMTQEWSSQGRKTMISEIVPLTRDSVYFGSENMGLHLLKDGEIVQKTLPATYISYTTDDAIYFLTTLELMRFKNNNWDTIYQFKDFNNLYFKDMIVDREGNILIGAEGNLIMLTPGFVHAQSRSTNGEVGLNHSIVARDNGQILIGTAGGHLLDASDRKIRSFDSIPVANNSVTEVIYEDDKKHLWIGTSMSGIIYLGDRGEYQVFDQRSGLFDTEIHFFKTFSNGSFWCGGYEGISQIFYSDTKVHFENQLAQGKRNEIPVFIDMVEGPDGRYWAISESGIFEVVGDGLFEYNLDDRPLPPISGIVNNSEKNFWLATQGRGLLYLGFDEDDNPQILNTYGRKDGLMSDVVLGVSLDTTDHIWVFHQYGFSRFSTDFGLGKKRNFTREDGWPNVATAKIKITQDAKGLIWVVTNTAVVHFNPYQLPINNEKPRTFISQIITQDRKSELTSYKPMRKADDYSYRFRSGTNVVTFDYHCTSFTRPAKVSYRYMLMGLHDEWFGPVKERSISFTGLRPGQYTFRVQGINSSGLRGLEAQPVKFRILPPLYWRWWAKLLYIIISAAIIYYFFRFYVKQRDQKQEALRLKELDEVKTNLYTNITHEFRTPLTVIGGMAGELQSQVKDDQQHKLRMIIRNSQKLLGLVNQMLDFSKVQAGRLNVVQEYTDVVPFTGYLVEAHQSLAEIREIELRFQSFEEQLYLNIDRSKLEQILTNLIANAVKFTNAGGLVEVFLKKEINELLIEIRDDGIGISEADLPHIFDRFHRVESLDGRQGTGIGLALVKELMQVLGGRIEVTSNFDEGTAFRVYFPINHEKSESNSTGPKLMPVNHQPKDVDRVAISPNHLPMVLLAEDNADVALYIKSCLESDYQLAYCVDGKEALAMAIECIPDLIITDVMMPEMDGFAFCQAIKEDERTNHIPVIMLTAKATVEDRLSGLRLGADAYLTKPFHKEELLVRIGKLLAVRALLQEKYGKQLRDNLVVPAAEKDPFVQKVEEIVLTHLDSQDLSVETLSNELHLSQSQTYRKLKAITGMSTAVFIRHIRLQHASELLRDHSMNISDIAFATGFHTLAYFSRTFKEEFGVNPSQFRQDLKKNSNN